MRISYFVIGVILLLIVLAITLSFGKDIIPAISSFFGNASSAIKIK